MAISGDSVNLTTWCEVFHKNLLGFVIHEIVSSCGITYLVCA